MENDIDVLTGLLDRNAFEAALQAALAGARAGGGPVSLALFDIDHFFNINKEFGHSGGDAVLKGLAEIVKKNLTSEIASRYGGDEFAIIFPAIEREQAFLKLEQIRVEAAALKDFQDGPTAITPKLTISGGIASFPIDAADESELIRKADAALYRAKASGRNKISLSYEERLVPKTAHYTQTQLERLSILAKDEGVGEAVLLREALDDLLIKYLHAFYPPDKQT